MRRGFTLIEMVLAITLSLGLIGTAMWFYKHLGDMRATVSSDIERIAARRRTMDRITMQIRNALGVQLNNQGMDGQTDRIGFLTATLPGQAAWAVRLTTDDPIPPEQDVVYVTWGLQIVEDDDGVLWINGLQSSEEKITAVAVAEEGQQIQSVLVSPFVRFVRFQYWNGAEWLPEWTEGGLPQAVEVAIGEEPLPADVEPAQYQFPLSRRVIYLPGSAGSSVPGGNIIRGLGGR